MSNETRRPSSSSTEENSTHDPLSTEKYIPKAVAGGIIAYAVGLISAHFLYIPSEGGFDFATDAIFYAYIHGIVPIQSNTDLVSGTALSQGGGIVLFFTLIFGIPIGFVGYYTARALSNEYGQNRVNPITFTGVFSAAYAICMFLTASQFRIEDSASALFTTSRTLTMTVDPSMSFVAGFVVCGFYSYYGGRVALRPEKVNMENHRLGFVAIVLGWLLVTGFWQFARAAS